MKHKAAMKTLVAALAIMLNTLFAAAQPYSRTRTFSISQGLTTNHISLISQDRHGLMWFSSYNGLWSFDGYTFTPYLDRGNMHDITSQRFISMKANYCDGVYFTDDERTIYMYDCRRCNFVNISDILQKQGISMKVHDLFPLPNGHTWLIGVRDNKPGLVRIDDRNILSGKGIEVVSHTPLSAATYGARVCANDKDAAFGDIGVFLSGKGKLSDEKVKSLVVSGGKLIWGGQSPRITIYDVKTAKRTYIPVPKGINEVSNFSITGNGMLICATDNGVIAVNLKTHAIRQINVQHPSSPSNHVVKLFTDSRHRIWAFTQSDGLTLISADLARKTWLQATPESIIKQTTAKEIIWLEDRNGTIWTIPNGGTFSYFDEHAGRLVPNELYEQDTRTFCIPYIRHKFVDRYKNLWAIGLNSVNLISFNKYNFKQVIGLRFKNVRSTFIDHKGITWTGDEEGYVTAYDQADRLLGFLSPQGKLQKEPVAFSQKVYSITEDGQGNLWIGTKGNGVYTVSANGSVSHYTHDQADNNSLSNDNVCCIERDGRGRMWIGTAGGGLNIADNSSGKMCFINTNNTLKASPLPPKTGIRRITKTAEGVIIVSTTAGLLCFKDDFRSPSAIDYHCLTVNNAQGKPMFHDVIQTIVMRSGRIFMSTIGGNISEVDAKTLLSTPKATRLNISGSNDGLVYGMIEDKRGHLWIIRENSLNCYDPASKAVSTFWPGHKDNFCDFTEAQPSVDKRTGRAVIAMQDGYVTFRPEAVKASSSVPSIVFTDVLVNGDKHTTAVLYDDVIELPADKHSLTINFAAIDYAQSQYIKYAYKLVGIDREWNNIEYNHRVSFNDLPTGHYKLLVRSTNADGQWVENTASVNIYARPAWWETWWANALYALIIIAVLYFVYKFYSIRRHAYIEKVVSERKTMLYREASHKLRTPLTLIGGPIVEVMRSANLTEKERNYLDTARSSSRRMLEIVDAMLSDNMEGSYFVDDENAPVFAGENLPAADGETPDTGTCILVVEDNKDLRAFLVQLLSPTYTVLTAENGREGLDKALAEQPDFILTDVTMPVMDGLTMVRMIKKNADICHIPIIILSAKASLDDKAQGLEQGIDDYITKPFSAQYLKQRMAEVIEQHRKKQQESLEEITRGIAVSIPSDGEDAASEPKAEYKLSSVTIVDTDREMMNRLMAYLEENIGNAELRVDDLASAVNLGRTVFFNKLKSIVGMSPTDFLRSLRIRRAAELIERSRMTISEISIATGFNDQRYFSRVFKKETGMTPSEYREKKAGAAE